MSNSPLARSVSKAFSSSESRSTWPNRRGVSCSNVLSDAVSVQHRAAHLTAAPAATPRSGRAASQATRGNRCRRRRKTPVKIPRRGRPDDPSTAVLAPGSPPALGARPGGWSGGQRGPPAQCPLFARRGGSPECQIAMRIAADGVSTRAWVARSGKLSPRLRRSVAIGCGV